MQLPGLTFTPPWITPISISTGAGLTFTTEQKYGVTQRYCLSAEVCKESLRGFSERPQLR